MEESITAVEHPQPPSETLPAITTPQLPVSSFSKVDNNLTGIGYFTASSKRSRKSIEKTTIVVDQGVEHKISILPSAKYGLPITQDQDFWLALMKLVTEHIQKEGKLVNPFVFTTAEILKILGHQRHNGKNYKAVQEWLSVMKHTGIEGGAYNAVKKKWFTDRISAVDRVLSLGEQLPDGTISDKNRIWFSQWQLDNINSGNLIPVELAAYTQLENNISKNLVPHLQEWLYASQRDGRFEKQYEDVCQLLGVRVYRYLSDIQRKFGPSLDELTTHGYLSKWAIEPMADRKHYKLVLWHGHKYFSDRQTRLEKKTRIGNQPAAGDDVPRPKEHRPRQRRLNLTTAPEPQPTVVIDYNVAAELEKRGVGTIDARAVLRGLPPEQLKAVPAQLEHADSLIEAAARTRTPIQNPQGFYISHLQRNVPVPATFESTQAKKSRQDAILAQEEALRQQREEAQVQEAAEQASTDSRIAILPMEQQQALFDLAKAEMLAEYPNMASFFQSHPDSVINDGAVRARMRKLFLAGWEFAPKKEAPPEPTQATNQASSRPTVQPVAVQPQVDAAKVGLRPKTHSSFATPFDLKALLSILKLPAPSEIRVDMEQAIAELAPAETQPEKDSVEPIGKQPVDGL